MAIALVSSRAAVFGSTGGTTSSIDTTGANFIVIGLWRHTAFWSLTLSDNKSNTWTQLTEQTNVNQGCVLFYSVNPTVWTWHTFTTGAWFVGVGVWAFSGVATSSPFDLQNGFARNSSGNIQPWSITPTVNDCLVVTALGSFNGAQPSMPTGYTQIAANTTGTAEAGGMGYKIQTTASTENPTWNGTGTSLAVVIADFKPTPAAWGTTNPAFLLNFV